MLIPGRVVTDTFLLAVVLYIGIGVTASQANEKTNVQQKESPWLIVPIFSSDPKLGTTLGALGGYLHQFDAESSQSMFIVAATYSTTDSWVSGVFGQIFFDKNRQKLILGYGTGKIRNDYQDFLGSGLHVQTTD